MVEQTMSEDLGNEILVHRFVDGEMSPTEEDAFLAECEADPVSYRLLAIALIERDRWNKQCATMVMSVPGTTQGRNTHRARQSRLRGLINVAASLLLGLMGGYLWNQAKFGTQESDAEFPVALTQDLPQNVGTPAEPGTGDVPIPETGRIPTTVANYSDKEEAISSLISAFQPEPLVPAEGVQQLRERGLKVEENTKLYVLELSDGRHLAVPTQFVRFSSQ